jgi:hypothetical protein
MLGLIRDQRHRVTDRRRVILAIRAGSAATRRPCRGADIPLTEFVPQTTVCATGSKTEDEKGATRARP